MKFDAIIIGGGAAGLFCAMIAGGRGRRVLVVEHAPEVGKKILISGGGRCNFTNINAMHENYISQNPHFCKSALANYTAQDFVDLMKKHRIAYYEKKLGQLFCRESAKQIVQMLLDECSAVNVTIKTSCEVESVAKNDDVFEVETSHGKFTCESLVIASGGLSIPKIGATDFGYKIARQFGLKIVETRPALVPLVFENSDAKVFEKMAGVALDSTANFGKSSFRENLLFTHKGLSGPAILQISNYWKPRENISINLLPNNDFDEMLQANRTRKITLSNFLSEHLPNRFVEVFCEKYAPNKPLNQLNNKEIESISNNLHDFQLRFDATEGYKKAEVTLGGVSTAELSSQTMESKRVKGLYFIGEIVDVTGWLGGYNFQWAWSSGFAAAQTV
ncbi:MAG: NAD(P)/FAD-dependent oxidoreductase [Pyrinomonadaceae bacterium]|nr:NAD(P)/FAD-dependent oxidoreductase [Pyrinomonadaceae bacterium]